MKLLEKGIFAIFFLQLYDGDFSDENELIGEYCGTSIPYLTRSRTNVFRIHFKTDPYGAASGFRVTYLLVGGKKKHDGQPTSRYFNSK